jgi:hypothetical protein
MPNRHQLLVFLSDQNIRRNTVTENCFSSTIIWRTILQEEKT